MDNTKNSPIEAVYTIKVLSLVDKELTTENSIDALTQFMDTSWTMKLNSPISPVYTTSSSLVDCDTFKLDVSVKFPEGKHLVSKFKGRAKVLDVNLA